MSRGSETSRRAPSWSGERTRPIAPGGRPRRLERGPHDVVDEHGDGAQSGGAGAQDARVQALQELRGDVDRNTGPRLERRADDAYRDPPHADDEAVGERARAAVALQRRHIGQSRELGGELRDSAAVEAQPVEHPGVEATRGRLAVGPVRRQDRGAVGDDELGRGAKHCGDRVVTEQRRGGRRTRGLALDLLSQLGHGLILPAHCGLTLVR